MTAPAPGAAITLEAVTKRFGPIVAVETLSVRIAPGSLTALLGPSGCGKTTTLSMIAGLLPPDLGQIRLDDTDVTRVRTEQRPIGLVFQKSLLFPHLSVEQNVGFGLRMRRTDRRETRRRVNEILDRVHLGDLAHRRPDELSGGQEQRVALARALILKPQVLLLDEPFSQLDATLRTQMRSLLRELHDESGLTTVFVTHDQAEAVEIADTIALLLNGRLAGLGDPASFYRRPPTLAVARFFGTPNEIAGSISAGIFSDPSHTLRIPTPMADGPGVLVIWPEAVRIRTDNHTRSLGATVTGVRFAGTHITLDLLLSAGQTLRAHTDVDTALAIGQLVEVELQAHHCHLFPA